MVVPAGGIDAACRFYADVVGLPPVARPVTMVGVGAWFQAGSQQLHVSEHEPFVPAARAHPAFELERGELDTLADRLTAEGAVVEWDERLPGARRFYSSDPAGNRLEFLSYG